MKYENPKLKIEVFDSDIVTAGGLIQSSNEGGVDPWPSEAAPTGGDLPPV